MHAMTFIPSQARPLRRPDSAAWLTPKISACLLALAGAAAPLALHAQTSSAPAPAAAPVIISPEVARRELRAPRYPSRDLELGLYVGSYSTQHYGTSSTTGLRLAYHVTEDFFVEGRLGQTRISDEAFRQVVPGTLVDGNQLRQWHVALGWNVLPGEIFVGRGQAWLSQGYVVAGLGSTDFAGPRLQTLVLGFGLRVMPGERWALSADLRDHAYKREFLGRSGRTHNPEVSFGASYLF